MGKKSSKLDKGPIYLTLKGLNKIKEELKLLVEVKRIEVTKKINEARNMGDVVENSVYDSAREEQAFVEGRIQELEDIISRAKIISKKHKKGDFVVIGSKVVVKTNNHTDTFTIVGVPEANPLKGKISNESPVGQALLGAKIGETVEVVTPIIRTKYKVLKIS